ncbi:hypothetical protein [Sporanaerobacter acetigenes]|uniref:hypothetical protein n=1 Tax=Sporanaerobacter acetigenes TaxID=165813 RepID=UPI0010440B2C|nr:hypothetical protein [Sporanaerobacter acetigenes]
MKKTLSLLLVLAMVLGSFSFAFADEAKVDPAVEAGEFLKKAGVLEGSDSGDLMLDKQLKRQDAVVLLSRLMKAEEEAKKFPVTEEYPTFKDITNNYYKPYLAWAQANKYYEGHNAEKFGYGEFLTAQQYATVLLRALGYEVNDAEAYKAAFETAKKLGIMKDLKVEEKAEITRGQMAQMTFNALGLKMKGSDKTLAEFLGIEMPAPAELKVEKVYTENLKEIVVELSNAKLVDKEKLENANNYKMTGFKFEKATVDGNNVILLLNESLTKGKKYELVVRNIDKAMNGTHKFTAEDNTIPAVEKVEVLGEYGIKVTTSEPVNNPKERNFLIDGKNVAMNLEQYGRILILTPYYDKPFSENAKTLTIKALEDFAGFKSIEEDFAIEMKKDNVAPKVTDVVVKGNVVEVTFDKDIYADSVEGYSNRNRTGNISYKDGRQTIYTVQYGGEKVDVNKAKYEFDREIPRRAEITIEGVTNHSDVKMEKVTTEGRIVVDYSEPALIDSKKVDYARVKDEKGEYVKGKAGLTIELYFDKDVSGKLLNPNEKDDAKLQFDPNYHFDIYLNDVVRSRVMEGKASDYIKSVKYGLDKNGKVRKDLVLVEITGLNVNNQNKDYEYVLEVRDFTDVTSFKNRMYRDYVDFNIPKESTAFKVESVKINSVRTGTEIEIGFNLPVDRVKAEDPTNYIFRGTNVVKDVEDLKGEIIVERNGKTVTLVLPEFDASKYDTLEILPTLKDIWYGNRLTGDRVYDFKAGKLLPAPETNPLPEQKKELTGAKEIKAYAAAVISPTASEATTDTLKVGDKILIKGLTEEFELKTAVDKTNVDALVAEINTKTTETGITATNVTDNSVKLSKADGTDFEFTHVSEGKSIEYKVTNGKPVSPEVKQVIELTFDGVPAEIEKDVTVKIGDTTANKAGKVTKVEGNVVTVELEEAANFAGPIKAMLVEKGNATYTIAVKGEVAITK